jgi:hypothetical protein
MTKARTTGGPRVPFGTVRIGELHIPAKKSVEHYRDKFVGAPRRRRDNVFAGDEAGTQ